MGEVAVNVIKWAAKIGFWAGAVFAFVVLLSFIVNGVGVVVNQSIIAELMGIVQVWLPFNLAVVFGWLITATGLYFTYRLAVFVLHFAMRFINNG